MGMVSIFLPMAVNIMGNGVWSAIWARVAYFQKWQQICWLNFRMYGMSGHATLYFTNGDKYVGAWRADAENGQGLLIYANGDRYVGDFADGQINGQGALRFANGDHFVGTFTDGKRNGFGVVTYATGDRYVGMFKDGKRHGHGTLTYANGAIYVGAFKDGLKHEQDHPDMPAPPCPASGAFHQCYGSRTIAAVNWSLYWPLYWHMAR